MQSYFLPAFFITLTLLVLLMVYFVQRKQRRVDAIRARYYSQHSMMPAQPQPATNMSQSGFQVLYERRSGQDRRAGVERRQDLRMQSDRRQAPGRRREDLLWVREQAKG